MHIILNNPYRTVGLLVGATAREQERQIRRLIQYIGAEQLPQDDFSFPALGEINRTIESINDAASKLNLDSDKINAALFWFYNGNAITDEPAFDEIKDGNTDAAIEIWRKLAYDAEEQTYNEVTKRNASAFHNLSTLYLQEYGIDEDTLQLKLLFLESDFFNELKNKATDDTYKISKKEIQLLFLNSLTHQENFDTSVLIEAISDIEFAVKADFLKEFVQQPISLIEKQIETAKARRKAKKEDVILAGTDLFNGSKANLDLLKSIIGTSDLKYISISDKVSDEVLQCGIQLFNDFKEHNTYDPGPPAMVLFRKAKTLASGNIAKQRCQENTEGLQVWIDEAPEREKQLKIKIELDFISAKLERFQSLPDSIANAQDLIDSCKPKVIKIRNILGSLDEFYLNISSTIVQNSQNMLVSAVNEKVERLSNSEFGTFGIEHILKDSITTALDLTFKIGSFDMHSSLRTHYNKNLEGIKSIAHQCLISTKTPKERVQQELYQAEIKLKEIQNQIFLKSEITAAQSEMNRIQQWQLLRSESEKQSQIDSQQYKIRQLLLRSENEKTAQIKNQQNTINAIKTKLQQIDY